MKKYSNVIQFNFFVFNIDYLNKIISGIEEARNELQQPFTKEFLYRAAPHEISESAALVTGSNDNARHRIGTILTITHKMKELLNTIFLITDSIRKYIRNIRDNGAELDPSLIGQEQGNILVNRIQTKS